MKSMQSMTPAQAWVLKAMWLNSSAGITGGKKCLCCCQILSNSSTLQSISGCAFSGCPSPSSYKALKVILTITVNSTARYATLHSARVVIMPTSQLPCQKDTAIWRGMDTFALIRLQNLHYCCGDSSPRFDSMVRSFVRTTPTMSHSHSPIISMQCCKHRQNSHKSKYMCSNIAFMRVNMS